MNVKLLTSYDSLIDMEYSAALAALTCRANTGKDFVPDEVLTRIIKAGHESILEHINLTYSIKGITRAVLQELARHRHISLSVESTRHTLRKNIENPDWIRETLGNAENPLFRVYALSTCEMLKALVRQYGEATNDELKYLIPECWPTNLVLTSNIRELRHMFDLRTAPVALREFRDLCHAMYEAVPEAYKYLLEDCIHKEASHE